MFNWLLGKNKSDDKVSELLKENESLKSENESLKEKLQALQDDYFEMKNVIAKNAEVQRVPQPGDSDYFYEFIANRPPNRPLVYDDNYVDEDATLSAAKLADLDMRVVNSKLDEAYQKVIESKEWDYLYKWYEWVYSEVRKYDSDYVDSNALRKRLIILDAWTDELADSLFVAKRDNTLRLWEREALAALEVAKREAKENWGKS